MIAYMTKAARRLISEIPGVQQVEVHADSGLDWAPSMIHEEAKHRRRLQLEVLAASHSTSSESCTAHPDLATTS